MCFYCKNTTTEPTTTTHVVTLKQSIIIIKNVPCEACDICGETYFSDKVMEQLEIIVNRFKEIESEVFVTDFSSKVA